MSADAVRSEAAAAGHADMHAILRFATCVTAVFVIGEYLQWVPTFLAPVLATALLANLPMRPPLKMTLTLIVVMAVVALFSFALASLFRGTPFVMFGAISLCMFLAFNGMLAGRPRLPLLLLLICISTIPVVAMVAPALAEAFPMIMVRSISLALLGIWLVYLVWPRVARPVPAVAPAPIPDAQVSIALLATAVVVPLMLFYLLFGLADALPVMVATVMLVANFDAQRSRMHALGMIIGNFAGGLLGLVMHMLLLTTPNLAFLALLLFVVLIAFARRIVAGGPSAGIALLTCNAMLIILSLAIASGPGSLSVWLTRLLQFVLAGAFAVGMMSLLWHRAGTPHGAAAPDPATL